MISYMISWFWRTYQGYQEAWSFMFHVHDIIYDIIVYMISYMIS